jgi:hypothetical protein
MKNIRFEGFDCLALENNALKLLVTRSVGPRVIALHLDGGDNLLAVLPDFVTERPDGKPFHFYGGHRLWHAPENMPNSYALGEEPGEIIPEGDGLLARPQVEAETGLQKSIQVSLDGDQPRVVLRHMLVNRSQEPIECAPWAITQLRVGGIAILPQSRHETDVLPNRSLALWPYTRMENPQVTWGNEYILVRAEMEGPFKIGFPNPRGWLAYWLEGTLFVKRAAFDAGAAYYDYGSSSECYCGYRFLELETLAPITRVAPGETVTHVETWELWTGIERPTDEGKARQIAGQLGLE